MCGNPTPSTLPASFKICSNTFLDSFFHFAVLRFGDAVLSATGSVDRERERDREKERARKRARQHCGGANKRRTKVRGGCFRFNKLNPGPGRGAHATLCSAACGRATRSAPINTKGWAPSETQTQPNPAQSPPEPALAYGTANNTNRSRSSGPRTAASASAGRRSGVGVGVEGACQLAGGTPKREQERESDLTDHPVCISEYTYLHISASRITANLIITLLTGLLCVSCILNFFDMALAEKVINSL